jgi:hypothetical protein
MKCTTTGYSMNCTGCVKISRAGTFTVKVQHTNLAVRGKGSSLSAGTTVCLAKVPTPVQSKGGVGVRVTATGPFGPLHVEGKHPKVFSYNVKTRALKKVKAMSRPGIYQIIV